MSEKKTPFPWYGFWALIAIVAGVFFTFPSFLMGGTVHWLYTLFSLFYLLFWIVYPLLFRSSGARNFFLAVGLGTFFAALCALPVVLDIPYLRYNLDLFAITLAIPFASPLSGLSVFLPDSYPLQWSALLVLGIIWSLSALFLRLRARK